MTGRALQKLLIYTVFTCAVSMVPHSGDASEGAMKEPRTHTLGPGSAQDPKTSCAGLAFLGAIRFYQKRISPIGGNRCGFWPSCSAYGREAIKEQGPLLGIIMIGDRQIRCNIWKERGPDYTLLPIGKLYDPPSYNLVFEKGSR
jgi:uncharacterized protein